MIFKPEDFYIDGSEEPMGPNVASQLANETARKKFCLTVYCDRRNAGLTWDVIETPGKTHRAYLYGIEEINLECDHIAYETGNGFACHVCGKAIKPLGWELVK